MRLTEYFDYFNNRITFDVMTHLTVSSEMKRIRRRMGGRRIQNTLPKSGESLVGLHQIDGSVAIQDRIDCMAGGRDNLHCESNGMNSPGVVCGKPPALLSNDKHEPRDEEPKTKKNN